MVNAPASERKKVMIVGAGLGAPEAARVAVLRGHQVHVFEREDKVGGQFNLAANAPRKHELSKLTLYQALQVTNAGGAISTSIHRSSSSWSLTSNQMWWLLVGCDVA